MEDFIENDKEDRGYAILNEEEIVEMAKSYEKTSDSEDSDDIEIIPKKNALHRDALKAIELFIEYAENQDSFKTGSANFIKEMQRIAESNRFNELTQSSIEIFLP